MRTMAMMWKCRRCRTPICDQEQLETHQRNLNVHKMSHRSQPGTKNCSSLFLSEPTLWMGSMVEYEGTLTCPNLSCNAKLGSWNWGGSQCSCGSWITPSICLVESKLDKHIKNESLTSKFAKEQESVVPVKVVDRSKIFTSEANDCEEEINKDIDNKSFSTEMESTNLEVPEELLRCSCSIHWFSTMPPFAVVVWLHGENQTGMEAKEWVDAQWGGRLIKETQAAFIFPDCGVSPVCGQAVWFDQVAGIEEVDDVTRLCVDISKIIKEVVKRGTPLERVFLGGVGHGGAAALHVGLRASNLGGVFCLGSALPDTSSLYSFLKSSEHQVQRRTPPVLCCHAKDDPEYLCSEGHKTAQILKSHLMVADNETQQVEWFSYNGSRHDGGIRTVANFLSSILEHQGQSI